MSKLHKLINFFLQEPSEARFADAPHVLNSSGFEEVRCKGSHHTFQNADGISITIPKKGGKMVKGIYVKQVLKLLNLK